MLFSILSGGSTIQKQIGENVYNFIRNFDKAFELKEPVTKMFQIKCFRQAFFHGKIFVNVSDNQNNSNMNDLGNFRGENNIYKMKDKVVKLSVITFNLTKQVKRTPKFNDKQPMKQQLEQSKKVLNDVLPIFKLMLNS